MGSRFTAVHQFHSGTAPGDAITQQMLRVRDVLGGLGYRSEVYAEHVDPALANQILSLEALRSDPETLLLWHHSIGCDAFDQVSELAGTVVAVYHNITPEEYFDDRVTRHYVRLGFSQLRTLAERASGGIADSNFNRREMLRAGFRRVQVLPVRTDFSEFAPARHSDARRPGDWLFVGRLVANKCQHELVRAFATHARSFSGSGELWLVGDTSHRDYVDFVRAEADRLGVSSRVHITGKLDDAALVRAFGAASIYVSLSEHEGFGVPLLEAMAAGVPVLAYGVAAVPETLGGAGVLLESKDPGIVAATVESLFRDGSLRARLVARQDRRVDKVAGFGTAALLGSVIARAEGASAPLSIQVQGPFETSYSLAVANRGLALGLAQIERCVVSLYSTEGPGDYEPAAEDLARYHDAAELFARGKTEPYPDVVIRQMWPPRLADSPGAITCAYFGWEESRIPTSMVEEFNRHLDGIGVMSRFVADVLSSCGVTVPIEVVGVGVDPPDPQRHPRLSELEALGAFRFLHISSAFPRKGVDVLLGAYFSAFDGDDDVSLILKTFPNPHNRTKDLLEQLLESHANPPSVVWIDRDLDASDLAGLYNLASAYVHPARGEGFGLPVAEAMAAGVPVISLAYSGLADFVSPETASCISFELAPAKSHLSDEGSLWAEPDEAELSSAMRDLFDAPDAPLVKQRAERARELIGATYSWQAVAARFHAFVERLESTRFVPSVAVVSTWNAACGIAEYTAKIVRPLKDRASITIIADAGATVIDPLEERGVTRLWRNRHDDDLTAVGLEIDRLSSDVIHVQFNFGFFDLAQLGMLLRDQLARRGVVVTLHRTKDIESEGELLSLSRIAETLSELDCVIVHQDADTKFLSELGVKANVRQLPIGTDAPPPIDREKVRANLGFTSRPVISTFGFLLPHKGLLELLVSVRELCATRPSLLLVALCARHPSPLSGEHERAVRAAIDRYGLTENVVLVTDFLAMPVAQTILQASDVIVLPYRATEESASAALHSLLGLGRPIVASDLAIFADARESLLLVDPDDQGALGATISQVLDDPGLSARAANNVTAVGEATRWDAIVDRHAAIYAAAASAGRARRARRGPHQLPAR